MITGQFTRQEKLYEERIIFRRSVDSQMDEQSRRTFLNRVIPVIKSRHIEFVSRIIMLE